MSEVKQPYNYFKTPYGECDVKTCWCHTCDLVDEDSGTVLKNVPVLDAGLGTLYGVPVVEGWECPEDCDECVGERLGKLRDDLDEILDGFADTELFAVLFVAKRLKKGREQYGVLNPLDGRDWLTEAAEERADMLVYMSAEMLRRESVGA